MGEDRVVAGLERESEGFRHVIIGVLGQRRERTSGTCSVTWYGNGIL